MSSGPRFLDRVRLFNKRTFNPWILRSAGDPRSPFAVVGHVGRRSGAAYSTPVIVRRIEDDFAFALTYGPNVDWYRNILAAGSCTLRWKGKAYKLEHPETMPDDDGLQSFPVPLRWVLEFNRIRGYFRMPVSPDAGGTAEDAESISQAAKR